MPNESESATPRRADARRNNTRILAAAEEVFSEFGAGRSTEEIARRAGVAIGTLFRHFPAKRDLLAAIVKELRGRLEAEAHRLVRDGDPATALFTFFSYLVAESAEKKTIVELLAGVGTEVPVDTTITASPMCWRNCLRGHRPRPPCETMSRPTTSPRYRRAQPRAQCRVAGTRTANSASYRSSSPDCTHTDPHHPPRTPQPPTDFIPQPPIDYAHPITGPGGGMADALA
nr:helix-turn-helix domain-containing protein [Nocardia transvalensis]